MSKKILVLLLVLFLFSGVFGLKQVEPYSKILEGEDTVGYASPNSTLELVFSKENEKFDSLKVNASLPEGFSTAIKEELEAFKVILVIPKNAEDMSYTIGLEFSNSESVLSVEKARVYFVVDSELLFVSMDNFSQETIAGESATYGFTLINNSDAKTSFKIKSSLPSSWYMPSSVHVAPKTILSEEEIVTPGISGERTFVFTVEYAGGEKDFDVSIKVNSTIKSKFASVLNGLPFYSFSLIPNYFLNGLFALLF